MALSESEEKRVREVLEKMAPSGHAVAYCMEHLAARSGLPPYKLDDLRTFVRVLRGTAAYTVAEPGVCDTGPHGVRDLVIRARPFRRSP